MRPVHWSDPFSLYRPWWISEHKSPCTYMFLVRVYRTHFTYSLSIASCCIICLAPTNEASPFERGRCCVHLPTLSTDQLNHVRVVVWSSFACMHGLVSWSVGRSVRLSARSVRSVRPSTRASVRSVGPWVRPSIRPLVGWSFGHSVGWSGGRSVIRLVGRSVVLCPLSLVFRPLLLVCACNGLTSSVLLPACCARPSSLVLCLWASSLSLP